MPRLLFVHAYALYTTLKNTVLSSFCFKSHIQRFRFFFFSCFFLPCCVPPFLPSPRIFTWSQSTFIRVLGWQRGGGGWESHPPLTNVHQKGWFGHEKQCQETGLNFSCTTHRKRKIEKKKESAWRMKLRCKLKSEGCCVFFFFFSASVALLLAT